jgi:hypothetical protein
VLLWALVFLLTSRGQNSSLVLVVLLQVVALCTPGARGVHIWLALMCEAWHLVRCVHVLAWHAQALRIAPIASTHLAVASTATLHITL